MGLQLRISPPANELGATPKRTAKMSYEERKTEVIQAYQNADRDLKRALTAAAIAYLEKQEGATISKQVLQYWRSSTADKSPFRHKYLAAYEKAIKEVMTPQPAN